MVAKLQGLFSDFHNKSVKPHGNANYLRYACIHTCIGYKK